MHAMCTCRYRQGASTDELLQLVRSESAAGGALQVRVWIPFLYIYKKLGISGMNTAEVALGMYIVIVHCAYAFTEWIVQLHVAFSSASHRVTLYHS
jgi:hypothetical protein